MARHTIKHHTTTTKTTTTKTTTTKTTTTKTSTNKTTTTKTTTDLQGQLEDAYMQTALDPNNPGRIKGIAAGVRTEAKDSERFRCEISAMQKPSSILEVKVRCGAATASK
jgi:hypothetical protein